MRSEGDVMRRGSLQTGSGVRLRPLPPRWMAIAVLASFAGCGPAPDVSLAAEDMESPRGGDDRTGHYEVVEGWWKAAASHDEEWTWGRVAGVAVDNPDRIIVVTRGDLPVDFDDDRPWAEQARPGNFIVVVDRDGNIIENWSQWDSIMREPHTVYISPYDPERHVWVIDNRRMQIFKFTNDGRELVMEIGRANYPETMVEARVNDEPYVFGRQADIAFLPDGSFYVADGYWKTRVVKFSAEGEYLMEWGAPGDGPGEFNLLHSIAVDVDRRVYVADRRNSRIQVFTEDGEFIEEWPDIFDPVNIYIDESHAVWVLDATLNRLLKYDRDGRLHDTWGAYGEAGAIGRPPWPGGLVLPHQAAVDQEGNLYVASYNGGHVQKFVPRPGADPARLLGQPMLLN